MSNTPAPEYFAAFARQYSLATYGYGWVVWYYPLNPKTGKPWQAARYVPGTDAHVACKRDHTVSPTLVAGPIPAFETWPADAGTYYKAFSTRDVAIAAIRAFDSSVQIP